MGSTSWPRLLAAVWNGYRRTSQPNTANGTFDGAAGVGGGRGDGRAVSASRVLRQWAPIWLAWRGQALPIPYRLVRSGPGDDPESRPGAFPSLARVHGLLLCPEPEQRHRTARASLLHRSRPRYCEP